MKASTPRRTPAPLMKALGTPAERIGWLFDSLKREVYAHRRRAEKARRRAERLHEPYAGYCRRLAEAYDNAAVEFEAEIQKAQFEAASVRGIDARTWVKP